MSKITAGKVQGKAPRQEKAKIHPKTDLRHWKDRLIRRSYVKEGKTYQDPFFSVQIQFLGRREQFVLDTPNKDKAGEKARDAYLSLLANGWEATLAKFKPPTHEKPSLEERPTVGLFLTAAAAVCPARRVSFLAYSQAFRKLVSDIIGTSREEHTKKMMTKWRDKVDAIPLDTITPDKVEEWKLARLRKAGPEPAEARRAKITVNSTIRNSRALFSRSMLPLLRSRLTLPSPLPLEGVRLEKKPSMRYASKTDPVAVITAAKKKLAAENLEAFKVLLLAAMCGLRVSEIDTLLWSSFDFDARKLRVEANQYTALKSDDSAGEVELDEEFVALFRGYKARATSHFVIESTGKARNRSEHRGYRIDTVWRETHRWLRANGVDDPKPLHALRKELGSLVNQQYGLVAAQRVLRHADIGTTAAYYVDTKGSVSVGLGKLIADAGKIIPFNEITDADKSSKQTAKPAGC